MGRFKGIRGKESRNSPELLTMFVLLCVLSVAACNALPEAAEGWQVAEVRDGDTIALSKPDMPWTVIRLSGIDAPEKDQPYGPEARRALEGLLEGCEIHFLAVDGDRYGRTVARLWACGRPINAELVKRGAAWVYTRYNHDPALPAIEAEARASGAGLWAETTPTAPWDWRHKKSPSGG